MKTFGTRYPSILLAVGLLALPSYAGAAPTVLHVSESAMPGDIVGIQGDGFGASAEVWMQHLSDATDPPKPTVRLDPVNRGPNYVAVMIPPEETMGVYAVWVSDGREFSARPAMINAAHAWGANDLAGTQIDAGRSFRLFGRNLYLGSSLPAVTFSSDDKVLQATVSIDGSDANVLRVTAPSVVAGTQYTVRVSNGHAGKQGWSSLPYQLTGYASGRDVFGLGVPWGSDFSTIAEKVHDVKLYGARGDGKADDSPAVRAAIARAAIAGGVVYFPKGRYRIVFVEGSNDMLKLASNVVLKGDGRSASTLLLEGARGDSKHQFGINGYGVHHSGIVDIGIHSTRTGASNTLAWKASGGTPSTKIFVLRANLRADTGKNLVLDSVSQLLVKDSSVVNTAKEDRTTFISEPLYAGGNTDSVFLNNEFSWYFKRVITFRSVRTLLEKNRYIRRVARNGTRSESGVIDVSKSDTVVVMDNQIRREGAGPFTEHNDGETIMAQGSQDANQHIGMVTAADPNTLTDSAKHWSYDYSRPAPHNAGQLYYVAIVSGPGAGQYRQITGNTPTQLRIGQPWSVVPTAASRYAISHCDACRHLVKDNTLEGNPQGIEYYGGNFFDVTFVDNTLRDNGGIWMRSDYRPGSNQFQVCINTQIIGNRVSNPNGLHTLTNSYSKIFFEVNSTGPGGSGTQIFTADVRGNRITATVPNRKVGADGEGYAVKVGGPSQRDETVAAIGVIFQNNAATNTQNAYHLTTGVQSVTIWGSALVNVRNTLLNLKGESTSSSHPAMSSIVGSTQSPKK